MQRNIKTENSQVTLYVSDSITPATIILGINGKSSNPDRHAADLTAEQARQLARILNAAADLC